MTALTDQELVEMLRKSNMASFDELYNRYWKKLYLLALNKVHYTHIAEEIVQELFAGLWKNRKQLEIETSVSGYLNMAVRYMVIKLYQKELHRRHYQEYATSLSNASNCTEEIIQFNDLNNLITQKISLLPEKCREVFCLSRFENLSQKEIATRMGISEKTVESQISKALRVLRFSLKDVIPLVLLSILL